MDKRVRVVMLPTNEKAIINKKDIVLYKKLSINWEKQNLYIISDDKIKEGDWCIFMGKNDNSYVFQASSVGEFDYDKLFGEGCWHLIKHCKKIIATTDNSLKLEQNIGNMTINPNCWDEHKVMQTKSIKLPQPSQSFIQKYIDEYNKGNIITDVMVEYERDEEISGYEYDVLKINPKDNTITIRRIKDSWTRDEVVKLVYKAFKAGYERSHSGYPNTDNHTKPKVDKWIEENL